MSDVTQQLIEKHEGRRSKKYIDTMGHPSIGIGHNLDAAAPCLQVTQLQAAAGLPLDDDWTDDSIDCQYQADLLANTAWLSMRPWWTHIGEARQAALKDMAFNLGPRVMQEFQQFLGLMASEDYVAAAADLLNTKVAAELPARYGELAEIIKSGVIK